jgi:Fucose dissimilation pathway protein FucU
MLIGISPAISPDLLHVLARMGHGDELVLADAFYPGETCASRALRADGVKITVLLDGILKLINPDSFVQDPIVMMSPVPGDSADPAIERSYRDVIERLWPDTPAIQKIGRFEFYERAKKSFAVVVTGETVKYGCIIIKKGVIPV